jgi:hypothetical protein
MLGSDHAKLAYKLMQTIKKEEKLQDYLKVSRSNRSKQICMRKKTNSKKELCMFSGSRFEKQHCFESLRKNFKFKMMLMMLM